MRRFGWLAWLTATVVVAVGLFTAYLFQSRTIATNADGASNAIQAWDMLHGNLLLRGWTVSDVSFYTTELPQYMLVESVRGLGPDVVHVCAAMTYTLLVLLAAWLAKGRATGAEGVVRALIAGGVMLAPQLGSATYTLILSPDHVGTGVPLLLAWILVDRAGGADGAGDADGSGGVGGLGGADGLGGAYGADGADGPGGAGGLGGTGGVGGAGGAVLRGWRWLIPVVLGVLLAWTAVGDPLALVVGAVPIAALCGMRCFQKLVQRRELLRAWYELSLALAAAGSVPVASYATRLIASHGGWTASVVNTRLAPSSKLGANLTLTYRGLFELFGADFFGLRAGLPLLFALGHLLGLALVVAGFCLAISRFFTAELVVQVLALAIVINVGAYVFGVQVQDIRSTREIAAVLPAGAVLAGRLLAGRLLAGRLLDRKLDDGGLAARGLAARRIAARSALALGAAGLACYAAMLGYGASQPSVPADNADLTTWLAAHGLTSGLGGYWQASSVMLDSGNAISVYPIVLNGSRLMGMSYWEARKQWYNPKTSYANFLVTVGSTPGEADPALAWRMTALAGRPAEVYIVGRFKITVWDKNLLTDLH